MVAQVLKDYEFAKNKSRDRHADELANKHKFAYMQPAIDDFTVTITANAQDQYKMEMEEFNKMKAQCIDERRKQLKEEFKENRMNEWEGQLALARDMLKQEEERVEREKREAKRREMERQAEEQRKADEERRRKRDAELAERAE